VVLRRLPKIAFAAAIVLGHATPCARAVDQPDHVYSTYGTHNLPTDSPCANPDCAYVRGAGEPTDPAYPA
jgi:hypothetical protein